MVADYISKSAVIKVLEDCYLDKFLFEKDVFDKINTLPVLTLGIDLVKEESDVKDGSI